MPIFLVKFLILFFLIIKLKFNLRVLRFLFNFLYSFFVNRLILCDCLLKSFKPLLIRGGSSICDLLI